MQNNLTPQTLLNIEQENQILFERLAQDILKQGYSIQPHALPDELCQILLDQLHERPADKFKKAGIGRHNLHQINTIVRSDKISWINGQSIAGATWLAWAQKLQRYLNKHLFLGLFSFESHFAHFAKGDFYKLHKDAFKGESNRILSIVVYLNQNWQEEDGGTLHLYQENAPSKPIIVRPELGTLVAFLSEDFPHEVKPCQNDRYSIAGWFRLNCSSAEKIDPPS